MLIGTLGACHAWVSTELGPSREIGDHRARIHRTNGTIVTLTDARVVGDSIAGQPPAIATTVAIPLADVERIELWRFSPGRTVTLGVALVVLYNVLTYRIGDSLVK